MSKRFFIFMTLFVVSILTMATISQSATKEYSQSHKVQDFTVIENFTSADIYYIQANRPIVEVVGPEQLVKNIKISTSGGKLTIQTIRRIQFKGKSNLRIRVASPTLTHYTNRGSGDFIAKKPLKLKDMTFECNGSGDTELTNLKCTNLTAITRGSGDIDIETVQANGRITIESYGSGDIEMVGQCSDMRCITRGSGDADLARLTIKDSCILESYGSGDIDFKGKSGNLSLTLRGSGDADIEVECQTLITRTFGSGDIIVRGHTHTFEKEKRGSGDIYSHGLKRK